MDDKESSKEEETLISEEQKKWKVEVGEKRTREKIRHREIEKERRRDAMDIGIARV